MSRSSEAYQEQQEQENLSGSDLYECWYEHNRRLLDEIKIAGDVILENKEKLKEVMK